MTDTVRAALSGCDLVHIESNHDVRMLENGPYPYYLKRRILADTGHLSNDACAAELTALAQNGTTRVLCTSLTPVGFLAFSHTKHRYVQHKIRLILSSA